VELKQIHSDLSIAPLARPQAVGIFYKGVYLCACPNNNIYDHPMADYGMEGPNGRFYPHPTRQMVLDKVNGFVKRITNDKDYHDAFFGEGEYTDSKLAAGGATDSGILVPDEEQTNQLLDA